MKKILLSLLLAASTTTMFAEGELSGKFTINNGGGQVRFSKGNLQFQLVGNHEVEEGMLMDGTFRFAEHQYDFIGDATFGNVKEGETKCNNQLIAQSDYKGWIDLFAWGSGYSPLDTVAQRPDNADHFAKFKDWGANAISNGGSTVNTWRTLTADEWHYLFFQRSNADILFGYGKVGDVKGLILLPDLTEWQEPKELISAGKEFKYSVDVIFYESLGYGYKVTKEGPYAADPYHNVYTKDEWAKMEAAGAVFFPCGGMRYYQNEMSGVSTDGQYWSSTPMDDGQNAYRMTVGHDVFYACGGSLRMSGMAVRLVKDVKSATAIENIQSDHAPSTKVLKNGVLYIQNNGILYTVQGQEVR
ncbi:MAG: hypothetical protein J5884_03865 [Paludibacteraceae bacterium]|nr:hypothetical protein [Paludibacteraceae bacterium]